MTTTRQDLLAWVHAQGLAALDEVFREEAAALVGAKGRHQTQRTHHHWGTAPTELTFGGRRIQVRRPRVRRTTGGEATLPSVAAFRDRDPLTGRMPLPLVAAGAAERDVVEQEAVVAHHHGLADDHPGPVVDEEALADPRRDGSPRRSTRG